MIKVSVVITDVFGVSGRHMMAATVLAQFARGSMRGKTERLEEAFTVRFTEHHAFLLLTMLARVDAINVDIDRVQARIVSRSALSGRR
jgi:hypothetical protein